MFPIMFGSPAWKSTLNVSHNVPHPPWGALSKAPSPWAQIGIDRISEIAHDTLGKQPKMILKKCEKHNVFF